MCIRDSIKTTNRRSYSDRWSNFAYAEPKPAVMRAVGPSRPADPPEPMVMAEASIFTGATRALIAPPVQWRAFTTVSVPWPSVSGARP